MKCYHCGAETSNGLALCDLCQRKARTIFDYLPVYFRNLARWRPGRAGSRPVPGSRVLYAGPSDPDRTGDRISDRLDEAANMLATWADQLRDDRAPDQRRPMRLLDAVLESDLPDEFREDTPRMVALLCAMFEDRLTSVATLDWCGDFLDELSHHEGVLSRLTEESIPGWYAGACRRCATPTYVVHGLTWVTCGGCGATTYARDHLDTVIDEARIWIARPMRLAEAAVALLDTEESVPRLYERIKKWEQRERITGHRSVDADGDPVGPKRYRFGDVLTLLFAEGATRGEAPKAVETPAAS